MAISKSDISSITYRSKTVGSKPDGVSITPPTDAEKASANTIISNLMGFILAKHS
jgi:hypothetical protein|tara:strand:- start:988 stop:1152 length:165 start_codon:yes stop_codon:yes gene_type:complete